MSNDADSRGFVLLGSRILFMTTRSDYDSAWKDALVAYFSEFLQLLRPHTYARIDWTYSPKFLDKELQAMIRSSARGWLLVDKLVSVQLT